MKYMLAVLFLSVANVAAEHNSLVGLPIDAIVENAGYPDGIAHLPNGHTLYTWSESNTIQGADFKYETKSRNLGYTIPGQTFVYWCSVGMEVDAEGVVVNVESRGNDCE